MELNEASLIENEFTVRNLKLQKDVLETRRSAIRWLALSLGILNPGESRLSSLAVLDALIHFQFVKNSDPNVKELTEYINANWEQINEKTLRYHLLRMKKMGFIENTQGKFYFRRNDMSGLADIDAWALYIFETNYKGIAQKVGEVIKTIKSRNAI
ncbi:MAG: hypothetical protein KGH72_00840 [Candidatus Micrarchaeota archaeon]|nr:hypothetical protein [Candidatus Micrarchaeota archaeon]